MELYDENRAVSREYAGKMLAQRFVRTRFANAVVVGVPYGGVTVASAIAERLNIPLEVMPCRMIKDPSDPARTIGSVSIDEAYYHDEPYDVPQDFLYFQMLRLRNEIKYETEFYYGSSPDPDFSGKTVILVDDLLTSPDALMAALMTIRKQRPLKVIVAVPFVEAEAARIVQAESDEFVFIKMKQRINSPAEFYDELSAVDAWAVRELLQQAKGEMAEAV